MLGVNRKPEVNGERKILPLETAGGVKVMSIGFFVEENSAVVWRGPMLHKAIQQFLEDVAWGELEYLLLDLPPGTGDVSMTLAQLLPQAKFVIVTTPQPAAQTVAKRAADMAAKFDLELLGAIENMSGFTTPDGERFTIFGEGGGQLLADELDIPLLGKVPLSEDLREHADAGTPLVTAEPDSPAAPGDPPGRPRHRRRHAAGAAGPAGSAGRGRGATGQRHAAADGVAESRRPERATSGSAGGAWLSQSALEKLAVSSRCRGKEDLHAHLGQATRSSSALEALPLATIGPSRWRLRRGRFPGARCACRRQPRPRCRRRGRWAWPCP